MAAKKTVTAKSTVSAQRRTLQAKQAPAPKHRTGPARASKAEESPDAVVTIDRRRGSRRTEEVVVVEAASEGPQLERRKKVQRRRQIDPTTCERDYSVDEVEFMNAMDDYKRKSGRMFPTCSEVLEVIRSLGYVRLSPAGRTMLADQLDLGGGDQPLEADAEEFEHAAF